MKRFARTVTRRRFLLISAATSLALTNRKVRSESVHDFRESLAEGHDSGAATNQSSDRAKRIAQIIEEYDSQGFHRTGTAVDRVSALWLAGRIEQLGLEAILEKFPLSRVDPIQAYIEIDGRRIEGVPMFDGTFTDGSGIKGKLGWLGTEADIAVAQISPAFNTEKDKQIQAYRRSGRYKGIIAITRGGQPGLAINSQCFRLHVAVWSTSATSL